jgi:hypothetical protein
MRDKVLVQIDTIHNKVRDSNVPEFFKVISEVGIFFIHVVYDLAVHPQHK